MWTDPDCVPFLRLCVAVEKVYCGGGGLCSGPPSRRSAPGLSVRFWSVGIPTVATFEPLTQRP